MLPFPLLIIHLLSFLSRKREKERAYWHSWIQSSVKDSFEMRLAWVTLYSVLVSAHFTLDSPASRGFSDDDESQAPCGGKKKRLIEKTAYLLLADPLKDSTQSILLVCHSRCLMDSIRLILITHKLESPSSFHQMDRRFPTLLFSNTHWQGWERSVPRSQVSQDTEPVITWRCKSSTSLRVRLNLS